MAYQALKLVALWTHLWHTLPNALRSARKQPTSQTANPTTIDQDLVKTQNTGPPLKDLLGGNLLASSWVRNIQKISGTESSSGCNVDSKCSAKCIVSRHSRSRGLFGDLRTMAKCSIVIITLWSIQDTMWLSQNCWKEAHVENDHKKSSARCSVSRHSRSRGLFAWNRGIYDKWLEMYLSSSDFDLQRIMHMFRPQSRISCHQDRVTPCWVWMMHCWFASQAIHKINTRQNPKLHALLKTNKITQSMQTHHMK